MRDLHPDLALSSQDEEMQANANTLAVLLNEIVGLHSTDNQFQKAVADHTSASI